MPDFMDAVQDRCLQDIEVAMAERTTRLLPVRTHCEADGCDEAISPQRQALRAQLCLHHQTVHEHQAKHRRGGR